MTKVREIAKDWLETADLRSTRQRVALAELLIGDGKHQHVSAESLHELAQAKNISVSLATVYNTLRLFSDVGLVNEITVDGHKSYFDTRVDEHPHFYWEESCELTDAPKDAVKFSGLPSSPEGTKVARVDVVIRLVKSD